MVSYSSTNLGIISTTDKNCIPIRRCTSIEIGKIRMIVSLRLWSIVVGAYDHLTNTILD